MTNRGLVYMVHMQRRDGQWIHYRTCDEAEAYRVAARLGVEVEILTGG
jgi:hypothetical protein